MLCSFSRRARFVQPSMSYVRLSPSFLLLQTLFDLISQHWLAPHLGCSQNVDGLTSCRREASLASAQLAKELVAQWWLCERNAGRPRLTNVMGPDLTWFLDNCYFVVLQFWVEPKLSLRQLLFRRFMIFWALVGSLTINCYIIGL